jgi:hypothetical protein
MNEKGSATVAGSMAERAWRKIGAPKGGPRNAAGWPRIRCHPRRDFDFHGVRKGFFGSRIEKCGDFVNMAGVKRLSLFAQQIPMIEIMEMMCSELVIRVCSDFMRSSAAFRAPQTEGC